jgi:hypothetical protein
MSARRLAQQSSTHCKGSGETAALECDRRQKQALDCKNPTLRRTASRLARLARKIFNYFCKQA